MSRRDTTKEIDWLTVSLYLGLVLTGWLMIYAVGYREEYSYVFNLDTRHGKQVIWIGLSIVVAFFVMVIDGKFYRTFAYVLYIIAMIMLVLVLVLGQKVAGATSWFQFGSFKFQPSEFAKFSTCLCLAAYLSSSLTGLATLKSKLVSLTILGLPMLLIILQPDAGSVLVFTALLLVLFREGMPMILYIIGITFAALAVLTLLFSAPPVILGLLLLVQVILLYNRIGNWRWPLFASTAIFSIWAFWQGSWLISYASNGLVIVGLIVTSLETKKKRQLAFLLSIAVIVFSLFTLVVGVAFNSLAPHQQDRINVWLHPDKADPEGSLYNLSWSKNAIGSGGISGKGYLDGTITKLNYVPEQATDFIFCTVGEEQGFIGVFAVIMLFTLLLLRITIIAERQRSKFTRIYAYGVGSILFFHLLVNVGMTMGLVPIIGIPLPFISYGGSSLISFTILLAILLKLDSNRLLVFR